MKKMFLFALLLVMLATFWLLAPKESKGIGVSPSPPSLSSSRSHEAQGSLKRAVNEEFIKHNANAGKRSSLAAESALADEDRQKNYTAVTKETMREYFYEARSSRLSMSDIMIRDIQSGKVSPTASLRPDVDNYSPLKAALVLDNEITANKLQKLIDLGARVITGDIAAVVARQNIDIFDLLVKNGFDPYQNVNSSRNLSNLAVQGMNIDLVKVLASDYGLYPMKNSNSDQGGVDNTLLYLVNNLVDAKGLRKKEKVSDMVRYLLDIGVYSERDVDVAKDFVIDKREERIDLYIGS